MKIGIREALFSGEEIDDWEPTNRFEFYKWTNIDKKWDELIQPHPDVFKYLDGRIKRIDGKVINWYQVLRSSINCHVDSHSDLGCESDTYLYDTRTESILFNNQDRPIEELKELYPRIEEAIDTRHSGLFKL